MAMSDLLFAIFSFPANLARLHSSWFIGGILGQAFCKIQIFLGNVSLKVLIQSLVLITVDPFGDVVIPLRFPLITSKQCPFFIVATWIVAIAVPWSYLVAVKLVEYPGGLMYKNQWQEAFKGTKYANYLLASAISCFSTSLLSSWWYFTPLSWSSLKGRPVDQVNNSVANA